MTVCALCRDLTASAPTVAAPGFDMGKADSGELNDDKDASQEPIDKDVTAVEEAMAEAGVTGKRKRAEPATKATQAQGVEPIFLMPEHVYAVISNVFDVDSELMNLLFQAQGAVRGEQTTQASADMFFIRTVMVTPNKFRPVSHMDGVTFEHPQNVITVKVGSLIAPAPRASTASKCLCLRGNMEEFENYSSAA